MIRKYISECFGVTEQIFLEALQLSPSTRGYILGAISELKVKKYLKNKGYEVKRIKEKPSGGNNAKEVYGDFYIRKKGNKDDKWLIVESKGLKSNSEFRGQKLDSPEKVFKFLNKRIFKNSKEVIYNTGYDKYQKKEGRMEGKE